MIVGALSPRGALEGKLEGVSKEVADFATKSGTRLGVIGGAGSLLVAPGGPTVASGEGFPAEIKPEADEMARILDDLRASDEALDWFYVSPAGSFGPWFPGEHTGTFRIGGDVLMVDEEGKSESRGRTSPRRSLMRLTQRLDRRERFSVAY